MSQDGVSRLERGLVDSITVGEIRGILAVLGADHVLHVRWRGGELDRLLDEGHATLVGSLAAILTARGWAVELETSYSIYGERGSIDLVGWHAGAGALIVGEVKTEIASVEETLRRHDAKARLAAAITRERYGWSPRATSRILVLPSSSTARRRVARHEEVFGRAYPVRGHDLKAWLKAPSGVVNGLLFVSPTHGMRGGGARSPARGSLGLVRARMRAVIRFKAQLGVHSTHSLRI